MKASHEKQFVVKFRVCGNTISRFTIKILNENFFYEEKVEKHKFWAITVVFFPETRYWSQLLKCISMVV